MTAWATTGSMGRAVRALVLVALLIPASAPAQGPLVSMNQLSPEAALELAQASLASCRSSGYQVAVAVVDRMGVTQVVQSERHGPR